MAAAFLVVIAPNLWWLVTTGFQPFVYVEDSAVVAADALDYLWFPLQWLGGQFFFLLPVLALVGMFFAGARIRRRKSDSDFSRRYILALALGPFLIATIVFAVLGRLLAGRWGYPLWSFAPLALLRWFEPVMTPRRLRNFARAFVVLFVITPVAYVAIELFEPLVHDRQKATHFPGREMAAILTQRWHEKTGGPLRYVGGIPSGQGIGEFAANTTAIYSPDRPQVLAHSELAISPWIDPADLVRQGLLVVWAQSASSPQLAVDLRARFPNVEPQPPLELTEQGLFARGRVVVHYAFVPPRR
jgi:hypothetical protein